MVRVLWQRKLTWAKGTRKCSTLFKTITEAEDNAFEFRYSLEDKATRLRIDEYKQSLYVCSSNVRDATELISSLLKPPAKIIRQPSAITRRKHTCLVAIC